MLKNFLLVDVIFGHDTIASGSRWIGILKSGSHSYSLKAIIFKQRISNMKVLLKSMEKQDGHMYI